MPAANAADDFCNNARGAPGPSRSIKLSCCYFVITFLMRLTEITQLQREHSQYNQISTNATFSMCSKTAMCLMEVRIITKNEKQLNEQTTNNDWPTMTYYLLMGEKLIFMQKLAVDLVHSNSPVRKMLIFVKNILKIYLFLFLHSTLKQKPNKHPYTVYFHLFE